MRNKMLIVGAVVIVAILLGQGIAYVSNRGDVKITTEVDGTTVSYDLSMHYDTILTEAHLDNHGDIPRRFMVLYDESYASVANYSDIRPTIYLLSNYLNKCRYTSFETASVEKVSAMIDSSISTGTFDTGLLMLTGALPDTVYDGTSSSKIIQWVNMGGYICWSGPSFGRCIAHSDGIEEVADYDGVCNDIFGTTGLFREGDELFTFEKVNAPLTDASRVSYNKTTHGFDMSKASNTAFLGYTDGQYASVGIMGYGNGIITVFGDWLTFTHINNFVNMATMGLTENSEVLSVKDTKVTDGHLKGSFEDTGGTYALTLHDMQVSRIWVFDRNENRFV